MLYVSLAGMFYNTTYFHIDELILKYTNNFCVISSKQQRNRIFVVRVVCHAHYLQIMLRPLGRVKDGLQMFL